MTKVELGMAEPHDLLLGFLICQGIDESGEFVMYSIGLLLFSIDVYRYKK